MVDLLGLYGRRAVAAVVVFGGRWISGVRFYDVGVVRCAFIVSFVGGGGDGDGGDGDFDAGSFTTTSLPAPSRARLAVCRRSSTCAYRLCKG